MEKDTINRVQKLAKESANYAQDVQKENWHVHYYGFLYGYQKAYAELSFFNTTFPEYKEMKAIREQLRLSLRKVADKTGVSAPTISRMEQGKEIEHGNFIKIWEFYKTI